MPPRQRITKEIILEAVYLLVKENGIEQINARNIASKIGCSTQPIFSYFSSMEELLSAIHIYACKQFETKVLEAENSSDFIKNSYMHVINLAKDEPNIFELIYLSKYCKGKELLNIRMEYKSNQLITAELQKKYNLNETDSKDVLERISIFVHGLATLIATSNISYTDNEIIDMTEQTLKDMILSKNK